MWCATSIINLLNYLKYIMVLVVHLRIFQWVIITFLHTYASLMHYPYCIIYLKLIMLTIRIFVVYTLIALTLWFYSFFSHIFTFFYINRWKYWFHANFRFLVFDGCTCFGISWTRFHYFWKVFISVCVWQKVCGKCNPRTNAQNLMKFYV